ncbi:MAG: 50S ribosomal protein L6 [Cytophagales bacterium]|nr:50S ribosomal protein L6 [Cytophagales bacterium]
MSRIGKKPIQIPEKVEVNFDGNILTVKGPKGNLSQAISKGFNLNIENKVLQIERPGEDKNSKSLHGLYRALANNMVIGVSQGYKAEMELVGVGYKVANTGNLIELNIGYSHGVYIMVPSEIKVTTVTEKGKNPTIILETYDKQLLGQVTSKIRSFRKPEPYKGKGIRFANEVIRRKAGKTSAKK